MASSERRPRDDGGSSSPRPSSSRSAAARRRLGRRLVSLADDDRWGAALSVLLDAALSSADDDRSSPGATSTATTLTAPALAATTPGGDSLIHLSSFASCDPDLALRDRRRALRVLEHILDGTPSEATRAAGDGGTALHGAVVAASSGIGSGGGGIYYGPGYREEEEEEFEEGGGELGTDAYDTDGSDTGDFETSSSSDEEGEGGASSSSDDADDVGGIDIDPNLGILRPDDPLQSHDSESLTVRTIALLLRNGSDPNVCLGVQSSTKRNGGGGDDHDYEEEEEDDDEVELTYSREAVRERWSGLTMCLHWLALAARSYSSSSSWGGRFASSCGLESRLLEPEPPSEPRSKARTEEEEEEEEEERSPLILPLAVLHLLLERGEADPTYPIGGSTVGRDANNWDAFHFVAGCAHLLGRCSLSGDDLEQVRRLVRLAADDGDDGGDAADADADADADAAGGGGGAQVEAAAAEDGRGPVTTPAYRHVREMLLDAHRRARARARARAGCGDAAAAAMMPLNPIQSFAAAVLADDVGEAEEAVSAFLASSSSPSSPSSPPSSSSPLPSSPSSRVPPSRDEVIRDWRRTELRDVLPTPCAAGWAEGGAGSGKDDGDGGGTGKLSILDAAAGCLASESVRFLLGRSGGTSGDEGKGSGADLAPEDGGDGDGDGDGDAVPQPCYRISDDEATDALASVFARSRLFFPSEGGTNHRPSSDDRGDNGNVTAAVGRVEGICRAVLAAACQDDDDGDRAGPSTRQRRQELLDRLLLRSCCENSWGTTAGGASDLPTGGDDGNDGASDAPLPVLLRLGADPNVRSVADDVEGGYRPLHLVAANLRRGSDGAAAARHLLLFGGDLSAELAGGDRPLDVALGKGNYRTAEFLWGEEQQRWRRGGEGVEVCVSKDKARMVGTAAIECGSLPMLRDATRCIFASIRSDSGKDEGRGISSAVVSEELGSMLLRSIDPRSRMGIACSRDSEGGAAALKECVDVLTQDLDLMKDPLKENTLLPVLPAFTTDDVSRQSPLHFLLRDDRGAKLRSALLGRICDLAIANERLNLDACDAAGVDASSSQGLCRKSKLVSLACDDKFGRYSALHLACALGCEDSIVTLVKYGADLDVVDSAGRLPKDLVREPLSLSETTRKIIGLQ